MAFFMLSQEKAPLDGGANGIPESNSFIGEFECLPSFQSPRAFFISFKRLSPVVAKRQFHTAEPHLRRS